MPTYRLNIQFDQAGLDTLNEATNHQHRSK